MANAPFAEDRLPIDEAFVGEIRAILAFCDEQSLDREREWTLKLYIERDPERQYLFFPTEDPGRWSSPEYADGHPEWRQQIELAVTRYAAALYNLAIQWSQQPQGADAYQLLHEVLYWDPGHAEARRVLGHRPRDGGWQIASERIRQQRASRPHAQLPWPPGSYSLLVTDHFEISSRADEATTLFLADQLQRCRLVWRQVFFDYWGNAGMLRNWLDGTTRYNPSTDRHRVVFFADRDQYLQYLSPSVPGIEASTGYYHDRLRTSFFYAAHDAATIESWRHELAHQLFQESIRSRTGVFSEHHLWLGEGMAIYFESLRDYGAFATLGGWDVHRLQFDRMRRLRLEQSVPWRELAALSQEQFQQHPQVRPLYSQSAGMCQFLMVGDQGRLRAAAVELLGAVYRGRVQPDTLERILGRSFAELDDGYHRYLHVSGDHVARHLHAASRLTALSVAGADLSGPAWTALQECAALEWLDLTGNRLTAADASHLRAMAQLRELYLNRCQLDDQVVEVIAELPQLQVLDISGASGGPNWREALNDLQRRRPNLQILGRESLHP